MAIDEPPVRALNRSRRSDGELRRRYERTTDHVALLEALNSAAWFDPDSARHPRRRGAGRRARVLSADGELNPDTYVPLPRWAARAAVEQLVALLTPSARARSGGRHARPVQRYLDRERRWIRWGLVDYLRGVTDASLEDTYAKVEALLGPGHSAATVKRSYLKVERILREDPQSGPPEFRSLLAPERLLLDPR